MYLKRTLYCLAAAFTLLTLNTFLNGGYIAALLSGTCAVFCVLSARALPGLISYTELVRLARKGKSYAYPSAGKQ